MDRITRMLLEHEGVRLKPYRCTAGKLTIGVGRNLTDVGLSEEEALLLLQNDITRARDRLEVNYPFWFELTSLRQDVLIDMCFNLGLSGLLKFRRMKAELERGCYEDAAAEMLDSQWALQVGQRAKDLAQMMIRGYE